ncbi:MAG: hypothetical protein IT455_18200 [Planctomycetes bacterium]|nr:hypothetical protein [Planctomycetota bacterium]
MHPRPFRVFPIPLLDTDSDSSLFLDCADCGCSSCLTDEEFAAGGRAHGAASPAQCGPRPPHQRHEPARRKPS